MKLVSYGRKGPLAPWESLQDEINRLFTLVPGGLNLASDQEVVPAVDLWEDEKNVYADIELPDFEQKDIKLSAQKDALTVTAVRNRETEEKKKNYYRCERYQGSFYRKIALPVYADTSRIKAAYEKGVLKVTLPKKEEEAERDIAIDWK